MSKSIPFIDLLNENLKDPKEASLYLNEVIALGDMKAVLVALRDVVEARGGITPLAEATGLHAKTLYRTLSSNGNPRLETLGLILSYSQLSVAIRPDDLKSNTNKGHRKYRVFSGSVLVNERKSEPKKISSWIRKDDLAYA